MEHLENHILKAENKWLKPLYTNCKSLFTDKKVQSHDHTHHLRVWEYCKEILQAIQHTSNINYNLVESCLMASLFHDVGLTKDISQNHGYESRLMCIRYFEDQQLVKPDHFEEILNAIEKHDDKEYKLKSTALNSITSILCCADDLDAFGNIGVIRYTEIYLLREVALNELPELVIKNIDQRFLNFEKTYKDFPELYTKHKERYWLTRNFFEALKKEL